MASKPRTTQVMKSVLKPRGRHLGLDRAGGCGELACVLREDFLKEVDPMNPPVERVDQGQPRSGGGLLC